MGTLSYAYNEDLMLAGIAVFKRLKAGMPRRKKGCRVHGETNMRPAANGYQLCRICQAGHSRSNYAKNREKILAHKRAKAKQAKAA